MTVGLSGAGFDLDLREGQSREASLAELLRFGTVEVKCDKQCRRTGMLFVEYQQPSGPSGIATTTADYWAFEYYHDCWLIVPTKILKRLAALAYRDRRKRVKGGDNDNYWGVLVPIIWLIREQWLAGASAPEESHPCRSKT